MPRPDQLSFKLHHLAETLWPQNVGFKGEQGGIRGTSVGLEDRVFWAKNKVPSHLNTP